MQRRASERRKGLALAALCGAAAGHGLTGDRAGEPLLRVVDPARARKTDVGESGARESARQRARRRRRPSARPSSSRAPLPLRLPTTDRERLEETATGKLRYTLKRPWRDGTVALVLEPLDLLARVCALIPPPRFHMIRYHGVLSSHAKVRAEVVPRVEELPVQLPLFKRDRGADRDLDVLAPEPLG